MSRVEHIGRATLYLGDCLEVMPQLGASSVGMVFCDLPYGVTTCAWDSEIPLDVLWAEYRRLVVSGGVVALTATQPFTASLVMSNLEWFRYELIWAKTKPGGFLNAKRRPLPAHESVLIFCGDSPPYNPIMKPAKTVDTRTNHRGSEHKNGTVYGGSKAFLKERLPDNGLRYPTSIVEIANPNNDSAHPTQKPVKLPDWMLRTYSGDSDLVMDNTMGSGTTGVAAVQLGRSFIGIEREPDYFDIACKRIEDAQRQGDFFISGEAA